MKAGLSMKYKEHVSFYEAADKVRAWFALLLNFEKIKFRLFILHFF